MIKKFLILYLLIVSVGQAQLQRIPGINADGTVSGTTTPQKIADSLGVQRVVTILSLKSTIGTVDGQTVMTEGYYTKGDCEPLAFYWSASSSLADNGFDATHPGTIIQPTSVVGNGRWIARRPNHINVKWFGAKADDTQNDQPYIQKAINTLIYDGDLWPQVLFMPAGTYRINSAILCKRDENGDKNPEGFSLEIRGESGFPYGIESFTRIRCMHNDTFGIGIQHGKGVRLSKLYITGQNIFTFASGKAAYAAADTAWVAAGCRDNTNSPYSGIVIDPFGPSSIAAGNRYPGFDAEYPVSHTSGGSTDVKIEECRIDNFVVDIMVSPNGVTQNAEQMEFKRCRVENARVGFGIGQLQSRSVRIEDFTSWGGIHTLVDCSRYGAGSGQLPFIKGGNMAGYMKYLLMCTNSSVCQVQIDSLFCESLYCLGEVNIDVLSFTGCIFKWAPPDSVNSVPVTILESNKKVVFDNCFILTSSNPPTTKPLCFTVGRLHLKDCVLDFPVINPTNQEYTRYTNCFFRHVGGGIGSFGNDYTTGGVDVGWPDLNRSGLPLAFNQKIRSPIASNFYKETTNIGQSLRLDNCEGANVTITTTSNGQATFTTAQPARWVAGPAVILSNLANEFGTAGHYVGVYVISVVSNTVTIGGLPDSFTTGSYLIYRANPYRYHMPSLGDTTNGSPVITNFKGLYGATTFWRAGEMISGAGIPVGSYVVSRTATDITINQNCTATATNVNLFDAIVESRAVAASVPTTYTWTKGDIIDDSTGATNGWRCTASGTFGSATTPTFVAR